MATPADQLAEILRRAITAALHDVQPELEKVAIAGGDAAGGDVFGNIGSLTGILTDVALLGLIAEPGVGEAVGALKLAEETGGKYAIGSALGYMMGYTAFSMLTPLFMPLQHGIAHTFTNEIHDPDTAAQLVARGLLTEQHGRDEASGAAVDADHFARLVALTTVRPDMSTALELLRRGIRSESFTAGELHRLGYDEDTVRHLIGLARNLLSPADLALANLRTEITDTEMFSYAKLLGVDESDMRTLVANTGEPPGLQELLEAYRRDFIDQERLVRGIRQSRVRNEWVDVVEKLRRAPMPTADAVRAVVEHHLTDAEGKRIAEQNGLEPAHWETLVQSWGRPLAHMEMASLVHRGQASRAQFDQAMRESDLKNKYIEQSFEIATPLLPERLIVQAIEHNALTTKEGAKILLQRGYSQQSVSILLKLGLNQRTNAHHELTRAEITSLYQEAVITHAQALTHLTALGYSERVAEYLLALVDAKQHATEVRQETAVIRDNYLAGAVDTVQAETELRQIGLQAAQAAHTVSVWNRERRRASRNLSEAQIVKAATEGVFHPSEALALLVSIGYSRANASVLLRSHGVNIGA